MITSPATNGRASTDPPLVAELRGITKTYFRPDGSVLVEALRSIDLQVQAGQYAAIMGASGSGKSTLMNILGCLDRPTSGAYLLDGRDVARMADDELSRVRGRKIGFVFQAFNLITELTIVENVEVPLFYQGVPKAEREERAVTRLKAVGLGDRLTHRPTELSGGQQQRVAIARSLVTDPSIIMADEPTGNLDSKTGEAILGLFADLHAQGMTVLVVTHDDDIADHCQRIIRLRDGNIESDLAGRKSVSPGARAGWRHPRLMVGPLSDRPLRILGIDPGLLLTGYGCVDIDAGASEPRLVEGGVFRLKPRTTMAFRLAQLHADLTALLAELKPDVMVVEQLFSHYKHARTSILMGHARGVVLLAAQQRGIELQELLPTAVKKAVTGNGHASKRQMQRAVMAQCSLSALPSPPDVADAIAIALCAARRIMLNGRD